MREKIKKACKKNNRIYNEKFKTWNKMDTNKDTY